MRFLVLIGAIVTASLPSVAADRALLVAVSHYEARPLQGPANDAALLYRILQDRGVRPSQIRLLADGLPRRNGDPLPGGPPTRAAILAALDDLAAEVGPGDTVFIAMSGHGTQAPARNPMSEPDGLDELFLPIDVGRWDEARGEVVNAIRDDEIGAHLDRLIATGAFVWIVIDTCHSGTATRNVGGRALQTRFVDPDDLGIPPAAGPPIEAQAVDPPSPPHAGNLVAFYASQANEVAYETELPGGEPGQRSAPHGVLSFSVAEALAKRPEASYLELAQAVRASYDRVAGALSTFPTPMFEGALERQVFGNTDVTADAWAARVDGNVVRIGAGSLHGLADGDEVLLHVVGGDAPVARGVVGNLGLIESQVTLDEPAELPSQLLARAAQAAAPRPLRVAAPTGSGPFAQELRAQLKQQLAARSDVEVTDPAATADLQVTLTGDWAALAPVGTSIAQIVATGAQQLPRELGPQGVAERIATDAIAHAPTFRLLTLASSFVATKAARRLSVERHLLRDPTRADTVSAQDLDPKRACQDAPPRPPATAEPIASASTPELFHCDTLYVSLQANGPAPIDIGLFFVDSTGALQQLPDLGGIRLDRKSPPMIVPLTISTWDWSRSVPSTLGLERLVILGVRLGAKVDRAYQTDFAAALGLGDRATPAPAVRPSSPPFLGLLGPDSGGLRRGVGQGDPREDGFMHVVSWKSARPSTTAGSEPRGSL